ncbi:MAG: NAD-dependent epimerase/dehydratase family protein [Albidovulum sp.]
MTAARVLLTGATGLIGRHCVGPLEESGFTVHAASRGRGDDLLADPEGVVARAGADHLIHLAWHDGAKDRWSSPRNLEWVEASLRLLRAFAAAGGRRAVMVGSCAEYDWTGAGHLGEDAPLRPATLYGAAKAATGIAAMAGAKALGVSLAWARVFFAYGPGEPEGRLLGDILKGIAAGRPVACTDGLQRRDFLHTEDIGRALVSLLLSGAEGPVNVGSGRAIPVRDLILALARAMGGEGLIRLGARPRPASDPALIEADVTRLGQETGFRPAHDLAGGIRAVLAAEGLAA